MSQDLDLRGHIYEQYFVRITTSTRLSDGQLQYIEI